MLFLKPSLIFETAFFFVTPLFTQTILQPILYRLDKQYSPIPAIASLYYLFDTIGIYHCMIYKILAYYINHIGIIAVIIYWYLPIFLFHL
jgi:hypothetical protein